MNALQLMNQTCLFMELGQHSLRIFNGTTGLELPLERQPDGKLTEACKGSLTLQLQRFISRKSWQPRPRVYCAIGARGVSLRRLNLPTGNKDEVRRLLPLQIEREFPLPPEQLAWGAQLVTGSKSSGNAANGKQEFLIAAVKRDSLEEYAGLLSNCGASPVFTLAALDRTYMCPQPFGAYSILALENGYSELITVEDGVPMAVRILPWGLESLARLPKAASGGRGESLVDSLVPSAQPASFGGSGALPVEYVQTDELDSLVRLINGQALGRTLYVTGLARLPAGLDFPAELATRLGNGVECRAVELPQDVGASAAVLGLQRAVEQHEGWPPLVLQLKQTNGKTRIAGRVSLQWSGIAAGLLLLALLLPYAEALALKSHLAKKLASIKTDQGRLAVIDRELDFLQYLKENEAPYLDALLVLAKAAPPGTRFDSVSMSRRGELSLRGSLRTGQEVADLRSKLIASGFFAGVAVEEQAPTPDHQKVNVRITAQWKPAASRAVPAVEPGRPAPDSSASPLQMAPGAPPDLGAPPRMPRPPSARIIRE